MSTTVTGTIKLLDTTAPGTSSFVRFWLRGCRGNTPRITGTGAIAPQAAGNTFYVDVPANASGVVSGTIYSTRDAAGTGNGEIEVGGSYTAVNYGMVIYNAGIPGPEVAVHAKNGASLDISNVTPLSTQPIVTPPTGDSTYARIDGGNQPFTGNVNAPVVTGSTGFRQGTMTAGRVLRSDGTNFVAAQLAAADLSNGVTGSGLLVEQTSPTLVTPNIGAATATSLTNTGDTTLSSGKVVKWNADSGISRVSAGILAVGNGTQGSTAGTLQVGTIQGATLTGATTGNNISILNAQGAVAAITGTGADAVVYTYSLPANTIDTNTKSLTIRAALVHTSGTANTAVKINLNGVNLVTGSSGTSASQSLALEVEILRTAATTGGVFGLVPNNAIGPNLGGIASFCTSATGLAWASGQTLTVTFNVAATDTWSGIMLTVKQNQ